MRAYRGVNETISSLLLNYIAIALLSHFVEGPMRDPTSLNKPSTRAIPAEDMLQAIPGLEVHWGLVFGVVACIVAHVLMMRSVFGFGAAIAGGNLRAGMLCGLPVRRMMIIASFLGGGAAGLAGMAEVAAVHGRANASLVTGYGYTGILVSFMARHEPLAIIPVALLFGGIGASNGLLQRVDNLPDATVSVLQGILFVVILASETLYGRFAFFRPREERAVVRAGRRRGPGGDVMTPTGDVTGIGAWGVPLAVASGAVRIGTPFLFVSLGECLTEKSGRVNLGLEGTLVMGAMSAYAISFYSGSAWLGVLVAGLVGAGARRAPRLAVQPAAGQRRRDRHRAHLVRDGPRLLPRQAVHPAERAQAAGDRPRLLVELSRGALGAADQRALRPRAAPGAGDRLHARADALGAGAPNRGRELRRGPRHGVQRQRRARDRDDLRRVLRRRRGLVPLALLPGSWNERLSSGQGLMAVALVIFAHWSPTRCLWAALLFGASSALGPGAPVGGRQLRIPALQRRAVRAHARHHGGDELGQPAGSRASPPSSRWRDDVLRRRGADARAGRAQARAPNGAKKAPPQLAAEGIAKSFGSLVVLEDVSLTLPPGRFHALLGENGAGKSTLVKCIMGYQPADAGRILIDGAPVKIASTRAAQALGIGMVYQHFTLVPNMTVAENLVLARANLPMVIDWAQGARGAARRS